MDSFELFQRLALALAIGLLVGVERGWQEREDQEGSRAAGIRTYPLVGLLGGIWGALTPKLGPIPLAATGVVFAAAFTLFQWREAVARNQYSAASTVAGMIVFALGAYAVLGETVIAGAAGVTTMALLAGRQNLHDFLRRLTWFELRSGVLLLAMSFVLLPILPNRPLDPFGAFNPFQLWLMTISLAVLSFAGYVAVRVMGQRQGLIVSAAAGALISSTAVTLNNSRLAAQNKADDNDLLAVPVCIAWMVSIVRMTVIAGVLNYGLLPTLVPPLAAALIVLLIAVAYFNRKSIGEKSQADFSFRNPFDLHWVLGFGALLTVVLVGSKILITLFGDAGLLVIAGVSGFADVDPVTLSAATLAGGTVTVHEAAMAILLAGAANLVTKMTVPVIIGGPRFGLPLVATGVLALLAGAAVFLLNGA